MKLSLQSLAALVAATVVSASTALAVLERSSEEESAATVAIMDPPQIPGYEYIGIIWCEGVECYYYEEINGPDTKCIPV